MTNKQIVRAAQPPSGKGWSGLVLTLCLLSGIGVGCQDAGVNASTESESTAAYHSIEALVERVEMTVVDPGSAKDERLILHVSMREDPGIRMPEHFNVLGMSDDGSPVLMRDDGRIDDDVAGDRTYSAEVDRSCIEGPLPASSPGKDPLKFTLTCDVNFISPGETCEGAGECPASASRSFLWGLIEYETDVVTCWCFQGCDMEFEFSLG